MKLNKKISVLSLAISLSIGSICAFGYDNDLLAGKLNPGFRATKGHSGNFRKTPLEEPKAPKQSESKAPKQSKTKVKSTIEPTYANVQNENINQEFDLTNTKMPSDEEIWAVINKYNFDENQKNYLFKETKRRLVEIYSNLNK